MSIQYANDGATLIDSAGNQVTVFDARYGDLLGILTAQLAAVIENKTAAANYTQAVSNAQISASAGRPYPALPDKPRQKVVSDTGAVSYVPFVPPLPDVVPLVVNTAGSGSIKVDVPDTQAIMFNMISALYRKAFPGGPS